MLASATASQSLPVADVLQSAAGTSADASGSVEPARRTKKVSFSLLHSRLKLSCMKWKPSLKMSISQPILYEI